MLTRATQGWACELYCVDGVPRTVWDGDQIVAEIRAPMQNPERDSGVATELGTIDQPLYGRVLYQHAGGLDRPAVMVRLDYDSIFPSEQTIIPQTNWLGNYDSGTFGHNGSDRGRCVRLPKFDNEEQTPYVDPWGNSGGGDNQASGDSIDHCVEVHWPAPYLWKTFQSHQRPTPLSWMGSLIQGSRDESGQMYRRNRYYDPNTGRFTQEDPIGIAGGLNVYGFANGDPANYSDPFGLKVCAKSRSLQRHIEDTFQANIDWDASGCVTSRSQITARSGSGAFSNLQEELKRLAADKRTWNVVWRKPWNPRQPGSVHYKPWGSSAYLIAIDPDETGLAYGGLRAEGGCTYYTPWSVQALIAHEFGHAFQARRGEDYSGDDAETGATRVENQWNAAYNATFNGSRPMRSYHECAISKF